MSSSKKVIAVLPARFASTRFPGKPLVMIEGKTLIQHAFDNAKNSKLFDDVIVATDDDRIFSHVKTFGGNPVMTSTSCLTGTDRVVEAVENLSLSDHDIILNIQGDEPSLEKEVMKAVVDLLKEHSDALMSTAVTSLLLEDAKNTSVVKCVVDQKGRALYFSRSLIPGNKQGEPDPKFPYLRHLGVYGFRRSFLKTWATLPNTPLQLMEDLEMLKVLEGGFDIYTAKVSTKSFGIDHPHDIQRMVAKN